MESQQTEVVGFARYLGKERYFTWCVSFLAFHGCLLGCSASFIPLQAIHSMIPLISQPSHLPPKFYITLIFFCFSSCPFSRTPLPLTFSFYLCIFLSPPLPFHPSTPIHGYYRPLRCMGAKDLIRVLAETLTSGYFLLRGSRYSNCLIFPISFLTAPTATLLILPITCIASRRPRKQRLLPCLFPGSSCPSAFIQIHLFLRTLHPLSITER